MANVITTLHPENQEDINLYPNIISDNIPRNAITKEKIDNNAIDTSKIEDGSVTRNKLSEDVRNIGTPTDEQAEYYINKWLDEHPEATTSVEDQSINYAKILNGTLNFLTPEMFGAVGDGSTDDSNAFTSMISYAETNNISIILLNEKEYYLGSGININTNLSIYGNNSTLLNTPLNIANGDIVLDGITFKNMRGNAIICIGGNLSVNNCYFEEIGIRPTIDVTYQGCGIYVNNDNIKLSVLNSKFNHTYGHGSIMLVSSGYINIENNIFINPNYRAIILYDRTKLVSGNILNNHIEGCGKYNQTGSGVGCNGIYSLSGYNVKCNNNFILNVAENGIEGNYLSVCDNYIDGTGVLPNSNPTPSTEGIYIYSSNNITIVSNNYITNNPSPSINIYTSASYSNIIFKDNILNPNNENVHSISINSESNLENIHIINNMCTSGIFLRYSNFINSSYVGDLTKLTNNRPNNVGTNKLMTNLIYKFDGDHTYDYSYSNLTPTYANDSTLGLKVLSYSYSQYNKLVLYPINSDNSTFIYLEIFANITGSLTFNLYKNGSYSKNINTITGDNSWKKYTIKTIVTPDSLTNRYNIVMECSSGSVILLKDIIEHRGE